MSKKIVINLEEKKYLDEPRVHALNDINLEVKPNEFVSILGPNGCGKSTLLKLVSGIDQEFKGKIIIGDRLVEKPYKDCAIVFQESRLLPWFNIEDNIKFGSFPETKPNQSRIVEVLKLLKLEDFRSSYPNQLSGGMAQKVSIARALVNTPNVLLLDEPFAAIDALTKIKLQEEITNLFRKEKTTVLMVTHDFEEALYLSDRIFVMSKRPGKLIKSFDIDLPRPRNRGSKDFLELHSKILNYIKTVF